MQIEDTFIAGMWLLLGEELIVLPVIGIVMYIVAIKIDQALLSEINDQDHHSSDRLLLFYTKYGLVYDILFWLMIFLAFASILSYAYLIENFGGFLVIFLLFILFLWQLRSDTRTARKRAFRRQTSDEIKDTLSFKANETDDDDERI